MCVPLVPILAVSALALSAAGTGLTAYGQIQQGEAAKKAANYQAQVAENNAKAAEQAGDQQAQQVYREGAQRLGAQRAALAANGFDLGAGSALDIQTGTAQTAGLDAATVRYNALVSGNNQLAEAGLARARGAAARSAGLIGAAGTTLQGASQFAGKWADWSSPKSSTFLPGLSGTQGGRPANNW